MKKLLKKVDPVIAALCVVILFLFGYIHKQKGDLKLAKGRVETREVVREIKVPGPTKIKYKTIIKKSEPEIIEKVVYKEAEDVVEEPVEQEAPKTRGRDNRYLLGIQLSGIDSERSSHALLAGYSFGNRLDVLAGVSPKSETNYILQAVGRF